MSDIRVVIGKTTVRASEIPHLETVGIALARRKKQLVTTRSQGAPSHVAAAYLREGGAPIIYMSKEDYERYTTEHRVLCITDTKYQAQLDKVAPDWRTRGWEVIHNPKALAEVAQILTELMREMGTPIEASA